MNTTITAREIRQENKARCNDIQQQLAQLGVREPQRALPMGSYARVDGKHMCEYDFMQYLIDQDKVQNGVFVNLTLDEATAVVGCSRASRYWRIDHGGKTITGCHETNGIHRVMLSGRYAVIEKFGNSGYSVTIR